MFLVKWVYDTTRHDTKKRDNYATSSIEKDGTKTHTKSASCLFTHHYLVENATLRFELAYHNEIVQKPKIQNDIESRFRKIRPSQR